MSGNMSERFDAALIGILQNSGGLEQFLDIMFGFLMRRYVNEIILNIL